MILRSTIQFILTLLLFTGNSFSQDLSTLEEIADSDTSSVETKIESYQEIIKIQSNQVHDTVLAVNYSKLSRLYKSAGNYSEAIKTLEYATKELSDLTDKQNLKLELEKADLLKANGKADLAMQIYLEVLAEYEDKGYLAESSRLNQKLGIIFKKNNDSKNALYHLEEAIESCKKINDYRTLTSSYMTIGNIYKNQKKTKEALKFYEMSIELCEEHGLERNLAGNYNNIGSLYRIEKNYPKSIEFYKKAVDINLELDNLIWLSYNYNNIGNVYEEQEMDEKALSYYEKSIEIKMKLNDLESLVETKRNMSEIYFRIGDYKTAHALLTEHITLKDSLNDANRISETKKIAAKFQSEKREAKIKELNLRDELNQKEIKARDERISYQNFLGWLMGVGILLIVIIALLLMFSARNRKKANEILVEKNNRIDSQHKEIIDSINYAKRIQSSILPSWEKVRAALPKCDIIFKPKDIVSGDFYLCDETHNGTYFGVVDCTGHGVPGAMVSLVASNHINKALHELNLKAPQDILTSLNKTIPDALISDDSTINDGMDVALGFINKEKTQLGFAGANLDCLIFNKTEKITNRFENQILETKNGYSIARIKGDRQGIGRNHRSKPFTGQLFNLEEGDKILMTSDGFPDQFGGELNKKFKMKEMRQIVLSFANEPTSKITEELNSALTNWQGNYEQIDDICVFLLEI